MMNLTTLSWTHDRLNTDGTTFTEDQFAGFTLNIAGRTLDGEDINGATSVPASWNAYGEYSVPLRGLIDAPGDYSICMNTVARNGMISEVSNEITFQLRDLPVPSRPFGLSVS